MAQTGQWIVRIRYGIFQPWLYYAGSQRTHFGTPKLVLSQGDAIGYTKELAERRAVNLRRFYRHIRMEATVEAYYIGAPF